MFTSFLSSFITWLLTYIFMQIYLSFNQSFSLDKYRMEEWRICISNCHVISIMILHKLSFHIKLFIPCTVHHFESVCSFHHLFANCMNCMAFLLEIFHKQIEFSWVEYCYCMGTLTRHSWVLYIDCWILI